VKELDQSLWNGFVITLTAHAPGVDELIRPPPSGAIKYLAKLPTFIAPDGLVHPVTALHPTVTHDPEPLPGAWLQEPGNSTDSQQRREGLVSHPPSLCRPARPHMIVADEAALEAVILAHIIINYSATTN